jgi:hypothetical protein
MPKPESHAANKLPFHERYVRRKDYDALLEERHKIWRRLIQALAQIQRMKEKK